MVVSDAAVTVVAVIVTAAPTFTNPVSPVPLVFTRIEFTGWVPAAGFVTPEIVKVAAVLTARAQLPPASVMVTVVTVVTVVSPVAVQFVKAGLREIVGVAVTVKLGWNSAVIVEAAASEPVAPLVKPTVHVDEAFAVCGDPTNVTVVTAASERAAGPRRTSESAANNTTSDTERIRTTAGVRRPVERAGRSASERLMEWQFRSANVGPGPQAGVRQTKVSCDRGGGIMENPMRARIRRAAVR